MNFTVVIPARYASTRLPGKPLLDIAGRPMLQHVWEQAQRSSAQRVVVATDDDRVYRAATAFGADAVMTDPQHPSGTDRLEEVVRLLRLPDDAIVVNVQGDEPLIPPAVINQVAANLAAHKDCEIATLSVAIESAEELRNPNAVKVVADAHGRALYFSRAPVPWPRDTFAMPDASLPDEGRWWRHVGIYAYRVAFLRRYVSWSPAPLERLEQLEQLRALYHGVGIHVADAVAEVPAGVDTHEDLLAVRARFEERL